MSYNMFDNDTLKWTYGGKQYCLFAQRDADSRCPRTDDNIATMACFHPKYTLGDDIEEKGAEEFWQNLVSRNVPENAVYDALMGGKLKWLSAAPNADNDNLLDVFERHNDSERWLLHEGVPKEAPADYIIDSLAISDCMQLCAPYVVWFPLWLYDHGGLAMRCGEKNAFADTWDSGCVGWIVVAKRSFEENGFDVSDTEWRKKAAEIMRAEVEAYNAYLCDEVYSYTLYVKQKVRSGLDAPAEDFARDGKDDEAAWMWHEGHSGFCGTDIAKNGAADMFGCGLKAVLDGTLLSESGIAQVHTKTIYVF